MKQKRHEKIIDLIKNNEIDTQEELLERLRKSGFNATQATISRDMRELKIVKSAAGKGKYKYVKQIDGETGIETKFSTILREAVKAVDFACNIVVVKAYTGMASAAGAAIDSMSLTGVVGSVAGDDTLILIARTEDDAKRLYGEIEKVVG